MRAFYTGIDVGTSQIKVVIASPSQNPELPMQIIGIGTAASRGMRHGFIVDVGEASKSIREAVVRASAAAKVKIVTARVSIGGIGLDELKSTGDISLTASGSVVSSRDMDRAVQESEKRSASKLLNRTIVHSIPIEYRIDGTKVFGKPEGLQGAKLAVDTLLITMISQHHDALEAAIEGAGVEVEGFMASPIAASLVVLTKAQKTAGVLLANMGAETLSLIVYENDVPISTKIFALGSSDITHAIALAFQVPIHEAEQLKRGGVSGSDVSNKKIQQIISSKLKDLFTLVNSHLKTINRQRLLPAGIIITGGGSGLIGAAEVARSVLKLPSQVSQIGSLPRTASVDATWAVAFGLCRWAHMDEMSQDRPAFGQVLIDGWDSIKKGLSSFLP